MSSVILGEVDLPEGVLVILDPGLERAFREGDHAQQFRTGSIAFGNGASACAVTDLPQNASFSVVAERIDEGDLAGRWSAIDVVVQAGPARRPERIGEVAVEHGELLFVGQGPLGAFRMWDSLDGLADFVFFGRDAPLLAPRVGALRLDGETFGWRDVPMSEIGAHAQATQERVATERLDVVVDYRPHCNLERLNAQIRESPERTGRLSLDGARAVGCDNRWGDGTFDVVVLRDRADKIARVRVVLETPARAKSLRRLLRLRLLAIVSRAVHDGSEPVRFADRMAPASPDDSGWVFTAGVEGDGFMGRPDERAIVTLDWVVERFPELARVVDAPAPAAYRRAGRRFVKG